MSFQREQRDVGHTRLGPDINHFALNQTAGGRIPPGSATTVGPEPLPPFSDLVEIDCQDCGGRGYDPGSVNPQEAEDCTACHGSGKETILRNYLAEAFRIAANPQANLPLERAHLIALTAYARHSNSPSSLIVAGCLSWRSDPPPVGFLVSGRLSIAPLLRYVWLFRAARRPSWRAWLLRGSRSTPLAAST
jgi:hypothetical protein